MEISVQARIVQHISPKYLKAADFGFKRDYCTILTDYHFCVVFKWENETSS